MSVKLKCESTCTIDNGENVGKPFNLVAGDRNFGFLFRDSDSYSIAWHGSIDFSIIDTTVLYGIPKALFSRNIEADPKYFDITVTLVMSDPTSSSNEVTDFIEYKYGELERSQEYSLALKKFRDISFARFDVVSRKRKLFAYSFTAENPNFVKQNNRYNELAIMAPLNHQPTNSLLNWIIDHHSASAYFKTNLLNEDSVISLKACIS